MILASDTSSLRLTSDWADAMERGKIAYISQPSSLPSACFGGLVATRAKVVGAKGIVVDGRFWDIGEIQELKLPVRRLLSSQNAAFLEVGCHVNARTSAIRNRKLNPERRLLYSGIRGQCFCTFQQPEQRFQQQQYTSLRESERHHNRRQDGVMCVSLALVKEVVKAC